MNAPPPPPSSPPRPSPPASSPDFPPSMTSPAPALPPLPPPGMISISPTVDPGVHQISLPPGTKLEGPPIYPSFAVQLANLSPDLLAIGAFIYWGASGVVTPAAAAGFAIALCTARMQPSRPGVSGAETIVRGVAGAAMRAFTGKKAPPP